MAKNELLPFADGEDANVLPTNQWEALTDILENGFQSGIARSEQVNRVLAQGAVASYVLGQLIVDQLNKDATLDKDTLYQNIVKALQENAKDACLPLGGGTMTGLVRYSTLFPVVADSDDMRVHVCGGRNWDSGAHLILTGKDENGHGAFELVCQNSDVRIQLQGNPDGSLIWNDKNVVCVESWSDGTSFYRRYSDGYIEQGGRFYGYSGERNARVPFHIPFTRTPNVQKTVITTSSAHGFLIRAVGLYSEPTLTDFEVNYVYGETDYFMWKACGY